MNVLIIPVGVLLIMLISKKIIRLVSFNDSGRKVVIRFLISEIE